MTPRNPIRSALIASTLGLLPMVGCIGASSDKQGSGYEAGTGGEVGKTPGTNTKTEQIREDKGDNTTGITGTARPKLNDVDATKTGGLGGARDDGNPLPGVPGTATGAANGEKPAPK